MKKKGLIVATIVMVLVLAVSLTTATYAWFSNDGNATVSEVAFSVSSASDVKIGVAATNTYKSEGVGFADFYSETTVYTANNGGIRNDGEAMSVAKHGTWNGDNNDLGLNVTLPFNTWTPNKAVFSASARTLPDKTAQTPIAGAATLTTSGTPAAPTFDPEAVYMIKANGSKSTIDTDTIADAAMNADYLHIGFGAVAGSTNVRSFGAWIFIDRTDTRPSVGILAGLHACYRINGGSWTDVDLYGGTHQDTAVSGVSAPTKPYLTYDSGTTKYTYTTTEEPIAGDAGLWVELAKSGSASTYLGTGASDIVQFELVIYLDGTDSDSITTALKNNSASIKVIFLAVNGTQPADA